MKTYLGLLTIALCAAFNQERKKKKSTNIFDPQFVYLIQRYKLIHGRVKRDIYDHAIPYHDDSIILL